MEYDSYLKRKESFDQNCHKEYDELWECCAKAMEAKIEARTTFESVIYNGPIKLLTEITEHSLCFEESQCEMATIYDAMRNFVNCKQKEKEGLLEHIRRLKLAREVLTSHIHRWTDSTRQETSTLKR